MRLIDEVFKELKMEASNVMPVGNHELKRHLVYKFEDRNLLKRAYDEYQRLFDKTDFTNMPFGFCHNDFDSRNVMIKNGKITGIIDFEISGYGYIENDLINLQRKVFCKDKALAQAFFEGYCQYSKLDMSLYAARMKVNLLGDVIENCSWAYNQAKTYFDENIDFLKTLIDC